MARNTQNNMQDALSVAGYFLEHSAYTKTNLQITKMTYIAHGYMLAIHGRALFDDRVEAWKHGPVIPSVYHEFKRWGTSVIGHAPETTRQFTDEESDLMNEVFGSYGRFCGYYLSQITHEDGSMMTPWKQCYKQGQNMPIPDEITKKYYKALLAQ